MNESPLMTECLACGGSFTTEYPDSIRVCRACELSRHDHFEASGLSLESFIAGSGWTFARTMPQWPHEYTVRDLATADARRSTCLSHGGFEWFGHQIREHGVQMRWKRWIRPYLIVGEWQYWTMGAPVEDTTIINRARIDDPTSARPVG